MTEVTVRQFRPEDGEALSALVVRCLREVNSRDYPAELIDEMCAHFTADRFRELGVERRIYVAEEDGRPVGTVSRDGNKVYTMFVDADAHGRGVGRRLMRHVEELARAEGHKFMETGASLTGHGFYRRIGYTDVRVSDTVFGINHILRRPLSGA
ncbi:GNAT family N-acetyltransferase [Micromonospora sp. MH99]|uniref:GNAT family N-acetyltransferase n=1 Tax=Micromonospora sp. MH99 TaxID=1945510 RepID=UPI001F44D111|nr:GNAT family N-acetyltransferase [Micromonospora sp. MH99]MCF0096697.1 putative N-acetyltransferase YafP [Micromonospora sp. MH99]